MKQRRAAGLFDLRKLRAKTPQVVSVCCGTQPEPGGEDHRGGNRASAHLRPCGTPLAEDPETGRAGPKNQASLRDLGDAARMFSCSGPAVYIH